MRIAIITILDNVNFGTYLQAYATYKLFKDRNCSVILVDYIRKYLSYTTVAFNYLKKRDKNIIIRVAYCLSYLIFYSFMQSNLKKFVRKNTLLSKKYSSFEKLKNNFPKVDLYLTGSDQVWNSSHNHGIDKAFFWSDFTGIKCSYAASVGINDFLDEEKGVIYDLLSKYKMISVRESFGVEVLKKLGLEYVKQVLDPTLVIKKSDWEQIASNSSFHKKEPYLLVYSVEPDRSDFVFQQAKIIAESKKLKMYVVCPSFKFRKTCYADRVFNFATVETFLSLMNNADYIVACSFHGTAFAINFEKQFISISPSKYNSRVISLLNLLNIPNCYISGSIQNLQDLPFIDYRIVNAILDQKRFESQRYIDDIVSLCK